MPTERNNMNPGDTITMGKHGPRYLIAAISDQHGYRAVRLAPDLYGWVAEYALLRLGWVVVI